jgi:hypothetical protein
MRREGTDLEEIILNHISNKGLISNICHMEKRNFIRNWISEFYKVKNPQEDCEFKASLGKVSDTLSQK